MKKQFLKKLTMNEIKNKVVIGSHDMDSEYAYIFGFYKAGEILVEKLIDSESYSDERKTLSYPILYNYRHYVELHLKSLIKDSEILYDLMDKLSYLQNGHLDNKVSHTLDTTHNLNQLLGFLKERLFYIQISDEEFPKDIAKYIKQIHDTDQSGQVYRYHTKKVGKEHKENFPEEKYIDIQNIAKIMKEINSMLWAIDSHIGHYIDISNDIISEYESQMRENYY